jgi:hypothetical protein
MSNEDNNLPQPWWLSWERAAASDAGNDRVDRDAWREDSQGWEPLDTLPNLTEPGDTGHNFLSDSDVEYAIRVGRGDIERVLGEPITTANWRSAAVLLDTSAVLAVREMFARRLAAAWLKHLASESDSSPD